ncbi:putative gas1-like protein [Phaeomoniella chlamydospora]|uniref:Putative gas1-like protein n=1 Tax=Phaeomoniella chlamydospora TaxID=158046 RepID=A0A0G2EQI5_PHACM|nr:putative gas1-like protein [Phaeomoniella chlamydospora]
MKVSTFILIPSLAMLASCHGVILSAEGPNSKVASVGMQGILIYIHLASSTLTDILAVVLSLARNCTGISPCQQDTAIIRDAEITNNIVNECGRTELAGNIDVGENTENQLAANQVADVAAGDKVNVTIHQVNADGAGPYSCDLDETSNTGVFSHTNLAITNNVPGTNGLSQAKEQDFNMQVSLPSNMNCTGASTGNVCTLRCRNNALAGPFGGCVALQQTDSTTGRVSSDPASITTNQTLSDVEAQVEVNKEDLNTAIQANQNSGADEADQGVQAAEALIAAAGIDTAVSQPTSIAAAVATGTAKRRTKFRA